MKKITSCGGYTHVRKSNFELLRLICIFGIVSMHIFGSFYNSAMGINLLYGVFINSMFNTCVSVFVLISGYFGIKFSGRKYLQLELEVLFYSILSTIIVCVVNDDWTIKDIIKAFLPVSSSKYWYITGYMLLMLFSGFINKVPEKLEKRDFQKLLLLMFIIFSAVPTIIWFHVMNDNGKGIANMLLMYFIGRYIRLYWDDKKDRKYLLWSIVLVLMGFVLNLFLTMLRGGQGVYAPFARDCSVIIVLASIAIFMSFKQMQFQSDVINKIAKHVVSVYLLEGAMRILTDCFFDITIYEKKCYLFVVIIIFAVVIIVMCIIVDMIRSSIAGFVDRLVYSAGLKCYYWFRGRLETIESKYKKKV